LLARGSATTIAGGALHTIHVPDMTRRMLPVSSRMYPNWLCRTLEGLRFVGAAVVTDVLDPALLERIRTAMYAAREQILRDVGKERLDRAREVGVMRVMMDRDPVFLELLSLPEIVAVVDAVVSDTSIMHLQNGLILPPYDGSASDVLQYTFHRDFPRYMDGYVASINAMLTIDAFTAENGGTLVVPGTHQRPGEPSQDFLRELAIPVECPAGSMFVFDSTLWHASGRNSSDRDRLAINHMFTRSFFKQQIDYVRALGEECVLEQPPRTQQLLGWYTRVVTCSDEYYRPTEDRLYRAGQG
jgi:ectoine hydroxylase-related dioxygenase (phytanoyl-CoA dioxygenase family)